MVAGEQKESEPGSRIRKNGNRFFALILFSDGRAKKAQSIGDIAAGPPGNPATTDTKPSQDKLDAEGPLPPAQHDDQSAGQGARQSRETWVNSRGGKATLPVGYGC
jgi:hypothetical protein